MRDHLFKTKNKKQTNRKKICNNFLAWKSCL